MGDLLAGGSAWWIVPVSLFVFGATFGLLPGLLLRLVVQLYPKAHPRREELFGELYHAGLGRFERFEWVFQQIETGFREGPALRRQARLERKKGKRDDVPKEEVDLPEVGAADLSDARPFGGGSLSRPKSPVVGGYDELQEIPRGRGMQAGDVAERIGPGLRAACGVTTTDSPSAVRRKVAQHLVELCERLPSDLRICTLAGLALHPAATYQFMQDRMGWAARQINRDHPRAAVRRMKVGFKILAEQLEDVGNDLHVGQDWYTASSRVLLRLDSDVPHLIEDRVITAVVDSLEEIELRFSAHASTADVSVTAEALYGGEITLAERVAGGHYRFVMRLPRALKAGERHEYGVRFTAVPRLKRSNFYVFSPLQQCDRVQIRVRFGGNAPKQIWQVDGVPPRAIDQLGPREAACSTDQLSEFNVAFSRLQPGLSYGVRWSAQGETAINPISIESH